MTTRIARHLGLAALALPLALPFVWGAPALASQDDTQEPKTFDPTADPVAAVEAATALAAKKHKRVLLVWGTEDA